MLDYRFLIRNNRSSNSNYPFERLKNANERRRIFKKALPYNPGKCKEEEESHMRLGHFSLSYLKKRVLNFHSAVGGPLKPPRL